MDVIQNGDIGQCFVLYGQKRSGKTSILYQLKRKLTSNCFTIIVSLGETDVDHNDKQINFIDRCITAIQEKLEDEFNISFTEIPSRDDIKERPSESFRKALRELTTLLKDNSISENPRVILLIDEFTYVFEYIKEGIVSPQFMRNWKALLQMKLFSAVVVGQDSMPKFKQAYPNEFGSTYDERISYLSPSEARKLAEDPILYNDKSRYRGHALERLLELTAGSPFYTNIMCDKLVNYLNARKAPFITEADIDAVLYGWKNGKDEMSGLISGNEILPIERFDPLITAAGESVAEFPREKYLQILTAIACKRRGAQKSDLPPFDNLNEILKDMHDREVIKTEADNYLIRVGLFAEWLRRNHVISGVKNYD